MQICRRVLRMRSRIGWCYVCKNGTCLITCSWPLQVAHAAETCTAALHYDLEDPHGSAAALTSVPGVANAAAALGYSSLHAFEADSAKYYEIVPLLSTFCLTPPGDTPARCATVRLLVCQLRHVRHKIAHSLNLWQLIILVVVRCMPCDGGREGASCVQARCF